MSEIVFIGLITLVWGVMNAGAGITAGIRISAMHGPSARRLVPGILIFVALLVGNLMGLFLWFALGYCENCSGKGLGTRQTLSGFILSLPSGLIWFVLLFANFDDAHDKIQIAPIDDGKLMYETGDSFIPSGPLGECPNCGSHLPIDSRTCLNCKAVFGELAAWEISPLKHNQSE